MSFPDLNPTDPVALLKTLVAIPSVNPMGRDLSGPEFFEGRMSDFLESFFQQLGVPCQRVEIVPGRDNVIACYRNPGAGRTLLLDAHQDTVPVEGMTIDPFLPEEKDGRIYGRGSCDVKGGMAAMLAAFARLVQERPADAANVIVSCTCDEEATSLGVNALAQALLEPERALPLIPGRPDYAIIAEPTELNIVVAHRGATRWKISTAGRACHSSEPQQGINAIYRMAEVVLALRQYAEELAERIPPHPLCGHARLSVGRIEGGISVNVVPDQCGIEIDRRLIPGENSREVRRHIKDYLDEKLSFAVEFGVPWVESPPLPDSENGPLADWLMQHISAVVGPRECVGVPYGTHASRIASAGIPSVVFGPGSIAQAHTKDEWIEIEPLRQATEIYYRCCRGE
jgi:succinyl-diaminopimelate desuccinylase